ELLDFEIFFDSRSVAGDAGLAAGLHGTVARLLRETPTFFIHLAHDVVSKKLPPHLSGGILRDVIRTGSTTLDLKDAMAPIVAFSRLYSLRHGVAATNTFDRLAALREMNVLKPSTADDLVDAYSFLMRLRLSHAAGSTVELKGLTRTEEVTLRQALAQLPLIHRKIGFDFPGSAL
ncbi:MAG TPA: putative nucleotidyltransferase substrate binding domain-containing protein, partial [Spirochaetia bacterium]|nr:putative nucleotidyltransferase substrate binding domain-containing protein [Spirochaetia bacterium]